MMIRSGCDRRLAGVAVLCSVMVMTMTGTAAHAASSAPGSGDGGFRWLAPVPELASQGDPGAASRVGGPDPERTKLPGLPGLPAVSLVSGGGDAPGTGVAAGESTDRVSYIDERGAPRPDGRPSRGRTILYSALVPGLGQLKWGSRPAGVAMVLGEVASWTSFITFRVQGESRKDRYIDHAERFAGITGADGEEDSYFQALARYDRSDPGPGSYNEIEVRLVAIRELYPDDPAAQQRYIEENSITGNLAWNWESEARRLQFADLRSSSESAFHRAEFAIGGMVAGRILSLMHAIWLTAERPGDDDEQDSDERPSRYEDHSLAQAISPYVHTGLDGDCRVGLRARF
jgi:hypothetical protein